MANGVRRLAALDPDGGDRPVLVHDGARPLASPALVGRGRGRRGGARRRAARPAGRRDAQAGRGRDGSSRRWIGRRSRGPDAAGRAPRRCCSRAWDAFPPEGEREFTDEAALLEACRIPVHAIPGDPANLKVTLPDDLRRVELALGSGAPRVGFGHDSHPFGPGAPLRLGGVTVDGVPAPGRPLGRRRRAPCGRRRAARRRGPRRPRAPLPGGRAPRRGASRATRLLRTVVERLAERGLAPGTVDLVIIGARPKLGARLDAMRTAIAATAGRRRGRGQREGLDRQPRRRRGRGPLDLRARGRDPAGPPRMTDPARRTRSPARRDRSSRSSPGTSASTAAARRSTARPTSATSGRSCSPTCSSATCATAGCA